MASGEEQVVGADALVHHIVAGGIRVCFANPGTTEMLVIDSFSALGGVRAVLCLHENVVTGAADGYGRMTRRPAMTLLHLGPGLANGLANLHNAKRAGTPILNVIGTMATWHASLEAPLKMDVQALAQTVSGLVSSPQHREELDEAISKCISHLDPSEIAAAPRVSTLLLPHNLQREVARCAPAMKHAAREGGFNTKGANAAYVMLQHAGEHGALFLGGDALCEPLLSRLGAVGAKLKLKLLCANGFARVDRGQGRPSVKRLAYFPELAQQELGIFTVIVFIDAMEPVAQFGYAEGISMLVPERTTRFAVGAQEIGEWVAGLEKVLGSAHMSTSDVLPQLPQRPQPSGELTAAALCIIVASLQPEGAIVVDESLTSGTNYWRESDEALPFSHLALTGGAIGQGPPCAVGAAIACPGRQVINLQADGSGLYTAQALWTQARERLNVLTIVCANHEYAILKLEMKRQRPRHGNHKKAILARMTELVDPEIDWQALAKAYGVPSTLVHTCEDFATEFRAAVASTGPRVIVASLRDGTTTEQRQQVPSAPVRGLTPDPILVDELLIDPWVIFQRVAAKMPWKRCIVQGEETKTYQELLCITRCLAAFLFERGVCEGTRIGIASRNRWEVLPTHFAAAALCVSILNVNTHLSPDELAYMLADATPAWLVVEEVVMPSIRSAMQKTMLVKDESVLLLPSGSSPCKHKNSMENSKLCSFAEAIDLGQLILGEKARDSPSPDTKYEMYYTSGTTGRPKGVMLTYENICCHAYQAIAEFSFNHDDVWGHFAPMYHVVDSFAILAISWAGGLHSFLPIWDAGEALDHIVSQQVTVTHVAATMMQRVLSNPRSESGNFNSLRLISCGGSALPLPFVQQAFEKFGQRFFTSYGMTECSGKISVSQLPPNMTALPISEQVRQVGSQGKPFTGIELRIQLPDGANASQGEAGEVQVRGRTVFKGYWNLDDSLADDFVNGWFRTGDVGKLDQFGWLSVIDRKKDVILFGGENVYAAEVERVIQDHPAVDLVAVIGAPDPSGQFGELVKAIVQLKPGAFLNPPELTAFCARLLARYKLPTQIEFLERLPLTASGKVNRHLLKQAARAELIPNRKLSHSSENLLWHVSWKRMQQLMMTSAAVQASWLFVVPLRELFEVPLTELSHAPEVAETINFVSCGERGDMPSIEDCELAIQRHWPSRILIFCSSTQATELSLKAAFHMAKAMSATGTRAQFVILTRGAQPIDAGDSPNFGAQAVIGWARAFEREWPYPVQSLDLCPHTNYVQDSACLLAVLRALDVMQTQYGLEVAVRRGFVCVPELAPLVNAPPASLALSGSSLFVPDRTYLVTGALGGVAIYVLRWMLLSGARNFVLVTRSSKTMAKRVHILDELREQYPAARFDMRVADISNRAVVRELLTGMKDRGPPCDGILHLAGELGTNSVRHMEWKDYEQVLLGKFNGALNLHECAAELSISLRHFVLFSSVYALLGYEQLSHYAAANAALDGLALLRHQLGLPVTSIQWGLWHDELSMAPQSPGFVQRWRSQGMRYLEPAEGVECLEQIMLLSTISACCPVVGAFPVVSWRAFAESPLTPKTALIKAVLDSLAPADDAMRGSARHQRTNLTAQDVMRMITDAVESVTGTACLETARFMDAGIDSVASLELGPILSQKFGVTLPSSLVFDYPTPAELSTHIMTLLPDVDELIIARHEPSAEHAHPSVGQESLRCLVLHGEAADAELMKLQMTSTGWAGRLFEKVELIYVTAPHSCRANIKYHATLAKHGLYDTNRSYCGWGLEPLSGYAQPTSHRKMTEDSVQLVEQMLQDHAPVHGICGICDGGTIAACVASRNPSLFFISFCAAPWTRLPVSMQRLRIQGRSLHLLGDADELYSQVDLLAIVQQCRNSVILRHDGGHVIPTCRDELRDAVHDFLRAFRMPERVSSSNPQTCSQREEHLECRRIVRGKDVMECVIEHMSNPSLGLKPASSLLDLDLDSFALTSLASHLVRYFGAPIDFITIIEASNFEEIAHAINSSSQQHCWGSNSCEVNYKSEHSLSAITASIESGSQIVATKKAVMQEMAFDTSVLGIRVAKVTPQEGTALDDLHVVFADARAAGVQLLTMSVPSYHQLFTSAKAYCVCVKVAYGGTTERVLKVSRAIVSKSNSSVCVAELPPSDKLSEEMMELSVLNGEFSRFHVDPRMQHTQMVSMFQTWVRNSVNRSVADHVLIATMANSTKIIGYITVKMKNDAAHNPPLFADMALGATNPKYRHLNVTWALIYAAALWAQSKGIEWMTSVTHEENKRMRSCAEALGMTVEEENGDFHFWIQKHGLPPPVYSVSELEISLKSELSGIERSDTPNASRSIVRPQHGREESFKSPMQDSSNTRCTSQGSLASQQPNFDQMEVSTNLLGISTGRMTVEPIEVEKLELMLKSASAKGYALLYWRFNSEHPLSDPILHFIRLEKHSVMSEVTFRIEINPVAQRVLKRQKVRLPGLEIIEFTGHQPLQNMKKLAVGVGMNSRYGMDPNMSQQEVSSIFLWQLDKALTRGKGSVMFVARKTDDSRIIGIVTALMKADAIEIELLSVEAAFQCLGVGLSMMICLMDWALERDVAYLLVTAGEDNLAACSLFEKCGGTRADRVYHAHFWLDDKAPNDPLHSSIPLNKPFLSDSALKNVKHAIEQSIATHYHFGPLCEQTLREKLQAQHVLLTCSGTAALEMCALSLSLKMGDEVIMPSYTFVSTANAFVCQGAVPVLVDIRSDTQNIDETKIEAAITSRTRAICCVHYAGVPCEMDVIMAIARAHNLFVVEDNAHGVFSSYKGRQLGTIGDCGALSFHYTKNLVCGEGGAVIINNVNLIHRAWIAWEKGTNRMDFLHGKVSKYHWVDKGSSYVMSEILAAVLHSQLEAWDIINASRMKIWNAYHASFKHLEELGKVKRPFIPNECVHNAHIYYLRIPREEDFKRIIEKAKTRQVSLFTHYLPLHQSQGAAKYARSLDCPETEACARTLLRLPMWVNLGSSEVEAIVQLVTDGVISC